MVFKKLPPVINNTKLFAKWDSVKNAEAGLDPTELTQGSKVSAYWVCNEGHRWSARIYTQRKHGCPFCSGHRKPESELLINKYPEVAKDWDSSKQTERPDQRVATSHFKAWFKCKNGHSVQAAVRDRVKNGCPMCNRTQASPEYNLETEFPQVEELWDYKENGRGPDHYLPSSGQMVYWKCPLGHSGKKRAVDLASLRGKCPKCFLHSSTPEIRVFCEILSIFPDAKNLFKPVSTSPLEADVFIPSLKLVIEYDGAYWHRHKKDADANKRHFFSEHGLTTIRMRESPLPILEPSLDIVVADAVQSKTSIDLLFDMILSRFNVESLTEEAIKAYLSQQSFQNIERFETMMDSRRVNSDAMLDAVSPELSLQWDHELNQRLRPNNVTSGSNRKVWWRCMTNSEHVWKAQIASRALNGRGCPYCAGAVAHPTDNLTTTAWWADHKHEWHRDNTVAPESLRPNSHQKSQWICAKPECGEVWLAAISDRFRGRGCPACANQVKTEKNKLSKTHERVAADWHQEKNGVTTPDMVIAGSTCEAWWKCATCGYEPHKPTEIRYRVKFGCKKCKAEARKNNRKPKKDSLADKFPEITEAWDYEKNGSAKPIHFTPGSGYVAYWSCTKCSTSEKKEIRRRVKRGCTACGKK